MTADDGTQIGLVSYGSDCEDPTGQPGVYTKVADNLEWIRSISGVQSSQDNNNNNYNPSNNNGGGGGGYDFSSTTNNYGGGAGGGGGSTSTPARPEHRPTYQGSTTSKPQGFTWPIIGG